MKRLLLACALHALPGAVLIAPVCASADEMTWTVHSQYPYRVQVEFYSQSRSHEWPGGGKAWGLNDYENHAFSIACNRGEKICYGAWVTGNDSRYWGVGNDNKEDCKGCCAICGEANPDINLVQ